MLIERAGLLRGLLAGADTLACAGIYVAAIGSTAPLRMASLQEPAVLAVGAASCVAWPVLIHRRGLYHSLLGGDLGSYVASMLAAGCWAAVLLSAAAFAFAAPLSPPALAACAGLQCAGLAALRMFLIGALQLAPTRGKEVRNVVIIGSGARALAVHSAIQNNRDWGMNAVGFLDDSDLPLSVEIPKEHFQPLKNLPDVFRDQVVDEVIVAWTRSMFGELDEVVSCCSQAGVPLTILSDLFNGDLPPPRVSSFGSYPTLSFAPVHHSRPKLFVKRGIDVLGSGIGLILAAPVWVVIAAAIRLTSPGPVLFRQARSGLYGRPFDLLKFRTMYLDAEARKQELAELNEMSGPVFKIRNDPRVTPVGRILRRWSLDELPQLFNVLRGEMSLVGPRPPTVGEVQEYSVAQRRRLSMRPGLTCFWQVSGRNRITSFEEWVKLDVQYIDGWSISGDLRLLIRTIPAVLHGDGAS